ncbi:MAG: C-terminal binding protein [Alphaproteobacteria bacterium]
MMILFPDATFDDDAAIERTVLPNDAELVIVPGRSVADVAEDLWRRADALIPYIEIPIDADVIARLDKCKIITRAGVGFDHIDVDAAAKRGIPVCNVPDYGTTEVADHAIALMLGLARGLVSYHQRLIANPAAGWSWSGVPLVRRLRRTRFGVVGLGRIGTAAARRAQGLDMEVSFYDPYRPDGTDLGLGFRREWSLEALLANADVVSLHCPLNAETEGMIGAEALAAMKPGALLINTARGGLIDIPALEAALRAGRIDGAGIDVLPHEPPDPDSSLLQAFKRREPWIDGRLLLTPHAAWYSPDGHADMRRKSASTVADFLERGVLRNVVNGVRP